MLQVDTHGRSRLRHAISEKLVRCLWYDRRWRPVALRTLSGQRIIVHDPGRWNVQVGPDFQQAVIEFVGGPRLRGDVEIHRYASGWTAHRHHLDARYNRVILHVFLWNDREAIEAIRADGQPVPQLALFSYLRRPLSAYQTAIVLDDYPHKHAPLPGRCYEVLRQLDASDVLQFFNRAGDSRLQQRVERWRERSGDVGLAQVMCEAVLRALGSTGHRQPFQRLAAHVRWQDLQDYLQTLPLTDRTVAAEALLLGLAGILEQTHRDRFSMDVETQRYLDVLYHFWTTCPLAIRQRAWSHVTWRQPHVRPANAPERRLAAMAQLLAQHADTTLLEVALIRCREVPGHTPASAVRRLYAALVGLFDGLDRSYWCERSTWGGCKVRARRLIGVQRARTIVVDAVLPVLLLAAQDHHQGVLQTSLLACYQAAPRLPDNALLRYMARRLLGHDDTLRAVVTGARQQQGILQIFYDHCDHDEGDCQGCDFPLTLDHIEGKDRLAHGCRRA